MPHRQNLSGGLAELRIAVASPFVDRHHGTERALAEALDRWASNGECEIHLYSEKVENVAFSEPRKAAAAEGIIWHRVPNSRGPHLLGFRRWYFRNTSMRSRDRSCGLDFDAVFSPGINCPDADVILVHAIFHRMAELERISPKRGLRGFHQRLYYRMLCRLERKIYQDPRIALAAVSRHTAAQLAHYFGRTDVAIVPNGVDASHFSPARIANLRDFERQRRQIRPEETVLLLIGNDWRNKGLPALLEAAAACRDLPLRLLVVGSENAEPFLTAAKQLGIADRITFALPETDVRVFYATADVLVAPSLEDSFNLPVLEAMSCGLPVVVSMSAGISEWIRDGENGLLLRAPQDAKELAGCIRGLVSHPEWIPELRKNAMRTAAELTWDRHANELFRIIAERASRGSAG